MATERMRVLELIREGKVSVDEGVRLLEALGDERAPAPPVGERPLGEDFVAEIKANVGRVLSEETVEDLNKTVSKVVSAVTKTVGPRVRRDAAWGRRRREERLASGWLPLAAEDGQVPVSLAGRLLVESTGGGLMIAAQPAEAAPKANGSADETDAPAAPAGADEDTPAVETPEAAAWAEAGEPAPEASTWAAAATAEQSSSEADGQPGAIATVEPLSEGRNWTWYALRRGADTIIAAYPTEAEDRHVPTLKVTVPARLVEIAARTVGGDIETERLDSPLDAQTRGGSIEINEHGRQPVTARTVGGNIAATGEPSQMHVRARGNVHFTGSTQEFDGRTAGGDLRLTGRIERISARTAGGNIVIEGARLIEGAHSARTAGGQIKVLLAEDSSANIQAYALGGGIHVDLPAAEGEATRQGPSRRRYRGTYRGTLGEGAADLDLRSVGGSIEIGTLPTEVTAD